MLIYDSVCCNVPPSASLLLRENTALLICIHRCQVGGESLLSVVVESIWCLRLHKSGSLCHFQRYFPFVVIGAYTLAKTENDFISPHKENENGQMRFSIALVISSVCVVLLTFWFSFCDVFGDTLVYSRAVIWKGVKEEAWRESNIYWRRVALKHANIVFVEKNTP